MHLERAFEIAGDALRAVRFGVPIHPSEHRRIIQSHGVLSIAINQDHRNLALTLQRALPHIIEMPGNATSKAVDAQRR